MNGFDLIVIGAGPGGYVAAIRAAQLGLKVALVEKRESLGGTCLNVGCIPSKALLESSALYAGASRGWEERGVKTGGVSLDLPAMMSHKWKVVAQLTDGIARLMKRHQVRVFHGTGRLLAADRVEVSSGGEKWELKTRFILLATGSKAAALPTLPFDGRQVISSTEALSLESVPKHLLVVGAGAVGLELGLIWRRLGAEVTVVELLPQAVPFADKMMARMLERALSAQGLELHLQTLVTKAQVEASGLTVELEDRKGQKRLVECDRLLVAVGRRPCLEGVGLEAVGLEPDGQGRVTVDEAFRTAVPGIYAIGDLIRGPMLAHKAEEEGMAAAELMNGRPARVDYDVIPSVVYTAPELAQVGLTEEQAREQGLAYKVGRFYFQANGRALCGGETTGLVKLIAETESGRLLGAHILGPHASELIAEAVQVMAHRGSVGALAHAVHAHPTLSEAVKEAALAVHGRAIHA